MTEKEQNQIRIIKLLVTNHHTTGEIAEELGYIDKDGNSNYSTITGDLEKLVNLKLICGKKVKRPGVRGPDPTAYFIKKDISVLSEIAQEYYDQHSRWQLSSSTYCKGLRPDIIEFFNKRLEDVNLDHLTASEHDFLYVYLDYPSVLYFVLCGTIPLNRIPEVYNQVVETFARYIKSNIEEEEAKSSDTPVDEAEISQVVDIIKKITTLEQTAMTRTFVTMSQTDRLMEYVPMDLDKKWQKNIASTVFTQVKERLKNLDLDELLIDTQRVL